ncbi:unnamed protein product [Arctogadus glacialis]
MEEKLIISVSAFPEISNTTLAGYKDGQDQGLAEDLSCEEPEAAAASEAIPPPTAAVTTPPIAPVRTQNRRRERERGTEIERLLLEVSSIPQ